MKKVLLLSALALALTACGGKSEQKPQQTAQPAPAEKPADEGLTFGTVPESVFKGTPITNSRFSAEINRRKKEDKSYSYTDTYYDYFWSPRNITYYMKDDKQQKRILATGLKCSESKSKDASLDNESGPFDSKSCSDAFMLNGELVYLKSSKIRNLRDWGGKENQSYDYRDYKITLTEKSKPKFWTKKFKDGSFSCGYTQNIEMKVEKDGQSKTYQIIKTGSPYDGEECVS